MSGLENKKIPASLLFRNFTNSAKVNTSEINQNDPIAKISICEKALQFPK